MTIKLWPKQLGGITKYPMFHVEFELHSKDSRSFDVKERKQYSQICVIEQLLQLSEEWIEEARD